MSIPSKRQRAAAAASAAAAGVNPLLAQAAVCPTQRRKGAQHVEASADANDVFEEMGVGRAAPMRRFAVGGGGGACSSSGCDSLHSDEGFLMPVVGMVCTCIAICAVVTCLQAQRMKQRLYVRYAHPPPPHEVTQHEPQQGCLLLCKPGNLRADVGAGLLCGCTEAGPVGCM